ncbi:MAG: hypothetical protein FWD15_02160 [Alphaproteobacteria bacterium]|nr:hypothetical protein [Alphaproteobacteria bacterium]
MRKLLVIAALITTAIAIEAFAQPKPRIINNRKAAVGGAPRPVQGSAANRTAAGAGTSAAANRPAPPVRISGTGIQCLERASVDLLKGECSYLIPGALGTDRRLFNNRPLLCVFETMEASGPGVPPSVNEIFLQQMYGVNISALRDGSNLITIPARRFDRNTVYGYVDFILTELAKGKRSTLRESMINDALVEKIIEVLNPPAEIERIITSRSIENVTIQSTVSRAQMRRCVDAADEAMMKCGARGRDVMEAVERSCEAYAEAFQEMGSARKLELYDNLGPILEMLVKARAGTAVNFNQLTAEVNKILASKGLEQIVDDAAAATATGDDE